MSTKVNRGKDFEEAIRSAFERVADVSIIRLQDPQSGFAGIGNVCDFIAYHYPNQYLIECKSLYGNTLSIHSNDTKRKYGAFTNNQFEGMLEASKTVGIIAGAYVWFIDYDFTIFIPIQELERQRNLGRKSISILHLDKLEHNYYIIPGIKKRVLFIYNLNNFIGDVLK